MDFSPLFISLRTAVLATVITFFLGIYAARLVCSVKRAKVLLDILFTLPLVLPPTVVGFFLLVFLGKNSIIGSFLALYGKSVVFSSSAAVIASTVAAFPLMYRTVKGAFEQLDLNIIYAARTLGASENKIFWRIMLPNAAPGVLAGTVLAFTRSIGEFGATIMLAGNIPKKTQTMAVAVYTAMQSGNRDLANQWVVIIVAISFFCILIMNFWSVKQNAFLRTRK